MTIIENEITQKAAEWLVSGRLPNEQTIQFCLAMLLVSLGYNEVEVEYSVPDGHMDIFLPRLRVVIETKALGEADPKARRPKPPGKSDTDDVLDPNLGETQFAQCERYVSEEWKRERGRFGMFRKGWGLPWKAILTDGRVWWMWQWEILSDGELDEAQTIVDEKRYDQSPESLVTGVKDLTRTTRQLGLGL